MAEKNNTMGEILEAMWKGELTMKPEPPKTEQEKQVPPLPEPTSEEVAAQKERERCALEHLFSGKAFCCKED